MHKYSEISRQMGNKMCREEVQVWNPPKPGEVKINVDGAVSTSQKKVGLGAAKRGNLGLQCLNWKVFSPLAMLRECI